MRVTGKASRDFQVKAISGIRTILLALNCPETRRHGLLGFAIQKQKHGSDRAPQWLRSLKVFESIVPDPKNAKDPADPSKPRAFYSNEFPVQSFLWGDYGADPDSIYHFRIQPMYGMPGALKTYPEDQIEFDITTEAEWKDGITTHGVWFNRGAIASQKFAEEFGNKPPRNINNPNDETVKWLSRGLLEACLQYINETKPADALRVAAYEFTYPPILNALQALIAKGIDVKIVYHDTTDADEQPNETAMKNAGLPINDQRATFRRSLTKIPHNKFIVRLQGGTDPVEVWTGSTNFTPSGFLGQTNVGHRVADKTTAEQYLSYWNILKTDPDLDTARAGTAKLTPDPDEVIAKDSIVRFFSPRAGSKMLDWYGRRMLNCANSMWLTAAFGVTAKLVDPIAEHRDAMRFVLMEKPATDKVKKNLTKDFTRVILSYGVPLGELYTETKKHTIGTRKAIEGFELDKWFYHEELYRPKNDGFVFFVHTKFLLIDPLSDDPLVCSGSANFSPNSLTANDENMLLIRGSTRVADIYMTEFDRIFRHFYFRDIANELTVAKNGDDKKSRFLDETDHWTDSYFRPNSVKCNRRLMFFETPKTTWFANAANPVPSAAKKKVAAKSKIAAKRKSAVRTKTAARKKKAPRTAAKKKKARKAK